jgi:hypothetical protein
VLRRGGTFRSVSLAVVPAGGLGEAEPVEGAPPPERRPAVAPHPLDRDAQHECLQARLTPERARRARQHREHVLHDVLGGGLVRQEAARQHADALVPPVERDRQRGHVAAAEPVDE